MVKKREKELVSIVVSNYNNEKYIEECLNSLINQSYKNIELIIVDDCSTDNSAILIKNWINKEGKFLNKKGKIKFVKLPSNTGFSGAVTLGLYMANGEFIAMQDGDDISLKNRIEKQVDFLKKNKKVNSVGTNYKLIKNNKLESNSKSFIKYGVDEIKECFAKGKNAVSYGTLLFRGYLFDKVGGLSRNLEGAEDYEFIIKLLPYGVDNIKEELYVYRVHEKQRSNEFYFNGYKNKNISKKELRVLLVLDQFNIGGTETHVLFLAKELIKKGVYVCILGGKGELEKEFRGLNCKIYNVNFPSNVIRGGLLEKDLKEKISRVIKLEKINLVHLHQSPSGSLVLDVARELGVASVFTIHGMYYHDIVSTKLQLADKIISVSYPTYDWLANYKIYGKVIANGVNYDEFKTNFMGENIRKKYGIKKDDFVAMYCSRMAWGKIKTCENLIRVCRDIKIEEDIEIHALIVGDGPGYEELKKIGDKANEKIKKELIHFTGSQTNLPPFYNSSDIIVGTGRVAIEGMASKKPVIATGNNGYFGLVDENNFYEAWKMYFGDHFSKKPNNANYLYDDLKKFYSTGKDFDIKLNVIYEKSKKLFEISNITDQIINVYLEAFK